MCYDVTKPVFKQLQKKKNHNLIKVCGGLEWVVWGGEVVWSGVEWSKSKFSDHSPHVQIVGELINYVIVGRLIQYLLR